MTSVEYQQLVEFLGRQFTEIDRRFDEVDGRFVEVYRRFTEMDRRFDEADLRFTELRQEMLRHFDAIYHRFDRLEQ